MQTVEINLRSERVPDLAQHLRADVEDLPRALVRPRWPYPLAQTLGLRPSEVGRCQRHQRRLHLAPLISTFYYMLLYCIEKRTIPPKCLGRQLAAELLISVFVKMRLCFEKRPICRKRIIFATVASCAEPRPVAALVFGKFFRKRINVFAILVIQNTIKIQKHKKHYKNTKTLQKYKNTKTL